MGKRAHIKLNVLSAAVALALSGAPGVVMAQDAAEADDESMLVEEVVVRGIRRSLMDSTAIKADAETVVEAITLEDIGKFPDQNIAESLQRITGVTIDRSGGEGQLLTGRGMGPEFNSTLYNGRRLATTSGGRAFSFDIMPSEVVSKVEVHKTQMASMQEGSIGATVDITSIKPMDFPGFQAVGNLSVLYDDMTEETKPQFSGLISDTFADDTIGILASLAYYQRESRYDQANTAYYRIYEDIELGGQHYDELHFPRNFDQIAQTEERERLSGTLVLQWQPSDTFDLTADVLVSNLDIDYRQDVFPFWFTTGTIYNPVVDSNNTVVAGDFDGGSIESLVRQSSASNDLYQLGLNMNWDLNDSWALFADVSYSEAEADPGDGWSDVVVGRPGSFSYDRSSGNLIPTMTYAADNLDDPLTAGWASLQGTQIEDEILEAKLGAKWTFDNAGPLSEINFGVQYSDRTLGSTWYETTYPLPWIYGDNSTRVPIPTDLFYVYDADGFLSAEPGSPVESWLTFNSDDVFAFLETEEAISQLDDADYIRDLMAEVDGYTMHQDPEAYDVTEELTAFYADFLFEGDIGNMTWSAVAGIRYVETDSTSNGNQIWLVNLIPSPSKPDEVIAIHSDDYLPVSEKNSYSDVLPSLNTRLSIRDDLIFRFSLSQSLTRPELDEMSPLTWYNGGQVDELSGWGSNPDLDPYTSDNIDISLEWYYDEGSYVAGAAFWKDVDGYLGSDEVDELVTVPSGTYNYTISRPVNLTSTKIDGIELAWQHMFTNLPGAWSGLGFIVNATWVDSESTEVDGETLPLIGLGDSQNLIGFYEYGPFQMRVAYNNRDRFMQAKPQWWRSAHYVDDYSQIDMSASWDFNDNFSVYLEGINITNEVYIKNAELPNQTLTVTETGARWILGVRGRF